MGELRVLLLSTYTFKNLIIMSMINFGSMSLIYGPQQREATERDCTTHEAIAAGTN